MIHETFDIIIMYLDIEFKAPIPDVSSHNWNMTQNVYKIKFQLTQVCIYLV